MFSLLRLDHEDPILKNSKNVHTSRSDRATVYWKRLVSMFSVLITGTAFALGHHFFYYYLDGGLVGSFPLSQAWVNRVATALAFLTKLMFVIACNIAYTQLQWHYLRKTDHELRRVDTLTGITGNILLFMDAKTWLNNPILLSMAIISWSLPIAAIFTPGTLIVQPQPLDQNFSTLVPLINYNNMHAFVQSESDTTYDRPTVELMRIAITTALLGEVLPIPSQQPNSTYHVQFSGPSLRCAISDNQGLFGVALRDKQDQVRANVLESGLMNLTYMAFVPADGELLLGTNMTAYEDAGLNGDPEIRVDRVFKTLDMVSPDAARIYVQPAPIDKAALIECQLHNVTYNVALSLNLPGQSIVIEELKYLNPVNATLGTCDGLYVVRLCDIKRPHPHDHMSYQAIMDVFGSIIVGNSRPAVVDSRNSDQSVSTSKGLTGIDWSSTESARRGLEDLFHNITLSAMSSGQMTSVAMPPNPIKVTVRTYPNAYQYDARNLLIAYGVSILVSLACAVVGAYAVWLNQASYQNCFSTFIRATWKNNADMNIWITEFDHGADPLPESVKVARVRFDEKHRSLTSEVELEAPVPDVRRRDTFTRLPSLELELEHELRLLPSDFDNDDRKNA